MYKGILLLDVRYAVTLMKEYQRDQIIKAIKSGQINPDTENELEKMTENWTQIHRQLYLGFTLRFLRLLAALVTISYFFAVLFKIMLDIQQDMAQVDWGALEDADSRSEWFLSNFFLDYDTDDEGKCTQKPC